jgi:hypothetical protein
MNAKVARSSAHAVRVALALSLASVGVSCGAENDLEPSDYPASGLYTPGSKLGVSDPSDTPSAESMSLGNRCVSPAPGSAGAPVAGTGGGGGSGGSGGAASPMMMAMPDAGSIGTLAVTYRTQTLRGRFAPKNCSAVWIETLDGRYVATIEVSAALRRPGLVYYQDHVCTAKLGPDVTTSATKANHEKPHMAEWTGVDFEKRPMPDGPYRLFIEVTETDKEPGELSTFDFEKGPAPFAIDAPVAFDGPLQQVSLSWELEK